MRHEVEEEAGATDLLSRTNVLVETSPRQQMRIDVHAATRPQQINHGESDHEGERGDHLEINQRLDGDAADLLGLLNRGNAMNDRTEDDQADEHANQPDEQFAQGPHPFGRAGHSRPITAPSTMPANTCTDRSM